MKTINLSIISALVICLAFLSPVALAKKGKKPNVDNSMNSTSIYDEANAGVDQAAKSNTKHTEQVKEIVEEANEDKSNTLYTNTTDGKDQTAKTEEEPIETEEK